MQLYIWLGTSSIRNHGTEDILLSSLLFFLLSFNVKIQTDGKERALETKSGKHEMNRKQSRQKMKIMQVF